jgi:hypothetical protein
MRKYLACRMVFFVCLLCLFHGMCTVLRAIRSKRDVRWLFSPCCQHDGAPQFSSRGRALRVLDCRRVQLRLGVMGIMPSRDPDPKAEPAFVGFISIRGCYPYPNKNDRRSITLLLS